MTQIDPGYSGLLAARASHGNLHCWPLLARSALESMQQTCLTNNLWTIRLITKRWSKCRMNIEHWSWNDSDPCFDLQYFDVVVRIVLQDCRVELTQKLSVHKLCLLQTRGNKWDTCTCLKRSSRCFRTCEAKCGGPPPGFPRTRKFHDGQLLSICFKRLLEVSQHLSRFCGSTHLGTVKLNYSRPNVTNLSKMHESPPQGVGVQMSKNSLSAPQIPISTSTLRGKGRREELYQKNTYE